MRKEDQKIIINGQEYLTMKQLAKREGFTIEGIKYRVKKLGIGVKSDYTNRTLVSLQSVEQCEKEGKFVKFR